jgi:molybdenum cofactor synthesis domain-containing protein
MLATEIIVVGDEVLNGLVQDTNSNYLCRVIRGSGGTVRRISVVPDEVSQIANEINAARARGVAVIFTCGGLGPTDDDRTLEAVSAALGRKLLLNDVARRFVQEKYRQFLESGYVANAELDEHRLKMARLPESATPIDNPVGSAPAVLTVAGGTRIVSLPGVPAELHAIVEGPLEGFLKEVFGLGSYREREVVVDCGDESVLAPLLKQVAAGHPQVYLKSHASHFGADVAFRLTLSTSAANTDEAEAAIERATADLTRDLRAAGIGSRIEDRG